MIQPPPLTTLSSDDLAYHLRLDYWIAEQRQQTQARIAGAIESWSAHVTTKYALTPDDSVQADGTIMRGTQADSGGVA